MFAKQKLELTWLGKDESPKLEPRISIEDSKKPCGTIDDRRVFICD
jgi:hypothetical protein